MDNKKVKKVIDKNIRRIAQLEAKKARLLKQFRILADEAKVKQIKSRLSK